MCEKVESKGRTTYNEVADELVKDFSNPDIIGMPLQGFVLSLSPITRRKTGGSQP